MRIALSRSRSRWRMEGRVGWGRLAISMVLIAFAEVLFYLDDSGD